MMSSDCLASAGKVFWPLILIIVKRGVVRHSTLDTYCSSFEYHSLYRYAGRFFKELGDYAAAHNTIVGMEANPPIYNTNYINDTARALDLIEMVGSDGFKLNLDMGTMVENREDISLLKGKEQLIGHVHISEPGLKPIVPRKIHKDLCELLNSYGYDGYISIEVGRQDDISELRKMMKYVEGILG